MDIHYDVTIESRHRALSVLNMLRPHRLEGCEKIRVGRMFDGGYVMLNRFDGITAAYSLGINDDVSWDLDIARRDIPIFQFDHTIEHLPTTHANFHWQKTRIGEFHDKSANVASIAGAIQENGHANDGDLILKCDIEGHEWLSLRTTPSHMLKKFRQIVVEVHGMAFLSDPYHADNVRTTFMNLRAHHCVVHVHANNHARWVVVGGIPIPNVLEITFARTDMGIFVPSDEIFPTALDIPCNGQFADYYLGPFVFA